MVQKRISDLGEDTTPVAADDFAMDTATGTKRIPYGDLATAIYTDAPRGSPVAVGLANADGASGLFARADHVHDGVSVLDAVLGGQKIALFTPQGDGTTAVGLLGWGDSAAGTPTGRALASTNYFTSLRRKGYVSTPGVGSIAGTRNNSAMVWRGDAAGLGGFYIRFRFGLSLLSGGENRSFVGLRQTTGLLGDGQPSAQLNIIALAADVGDSNWQVMHNDGSGSATKVDLGANFPYPGTVNQDCYSVELWCDPNASSVNYRITRENTGHVATGSLSTNLPAGATFLAPQIWTNSGATNASVAVDAVGQYSRVGVA